MIMNPSAIKHVVLDGHSLTLESFVAVARYNAAVELAGSALEAMQKVADGKATKIIIPSELQGLAGLAASAKAVFESEEPKK